MSTGAVTFRRIHELHQQIGELDQKIGAGSRAAARHRQAIEEHQAQLVSLHTEQQRSRMTADQNQVKLDAGEQHLAKEQLRLNVAKDNKEYSAIRLEMSRIRQANSKLEDLVLASLTKADEAQQKMAQHRRGIAGEEAELEASARESEAGRLETEGAMGKLKAELADLEQRLPGSMLAAYRRHVAGMGQDALAAVRDQVCEGCYTGVTAQSMNELALGRDMVLCNSCGRILYTGDE